MPKTYTYVADLANAVEQDTQLKSRVAADPAAALKDLQEPIPNTDVYKILIVFLGLAVLTAVIGPLVLAGWGKEIPQAVIAIGSTAVGALAGILAPSPSQRKG